MPERVPYPSEIVFTEILPAIDKVFHSIAYHNGTESSEEYVEVSEKLKDLIPRYIDKRLSSAYVENVFI